MHAEFPSDDEFKEFNYLFRRRRNREQHFRSFLLEADLFGQFCYSGSLLLKLDQTGYALSDREHVLGNFFVSSSYPKLRDYFVVGFSHLQARVTGEVQCCRRQVKFAADSLQKG